MNFIILIALLIIGLIFLIKGADYLVNGASSLAKCFSVSEMVIGLTIVAFGTSMPEMIVSIFSSAKGYNEIAFGNIIGSNIFNTLVILGVAGIINPIVVHKNTVWREIPFSLVALLILAVLINDNLIVGADQNQLNRIDGLILLTGFMLFFCYTFMIRSVDIADSYTVEQCAMKKTIFWIVIGLVGVYIGGQLVVNNAVKIARELKISEKLIALTLISIGTSLPELATTIIAAFKKRFDIAVGNVIGSNIFNVLLILGVSSLIKPIPFNPIFNLDLALLIGVTIFLFMTMFSGKRKKLDRWEAVLFLLVYASYFVYLILRR